MFTGIVEERGSVAEIGPYRLVVNCATVMEDSHVDSSVSVNGVCLTVVERTASTLAFDLSPETLARTSLSRLSAGDPVNLERPVTLAMRLGGHLVQGHVDGVGEVVSLAPNEAGATITLRVPSHLRRYIVEKGSVTVDGISLTAFGLTDDTFDVALIPHTLEVTTLGAAAPGYPVNIEVDVIARYVEQLVQENE